MKSLGNEAGALHVLEDEWLADAKRHVLGFLRELFLHPRDIFYERVEHLIVRATCE